jgi:hypothetical protein
MLETHPGMYITHVIASVRRMLIKKLYTKSPMTYPSLSPEDVEKIMKNGIAALPMANS